MVLSMWNERVQPDSSPVSEPPRETTKRPKTGCLFGLGEFLVILALCFLATAIAILTIGGGYEHLLTELAASPTPLATP